METPICYRKEEQMRRGWKNMNVALGYKGIKEPPQRDL